MVIVLVRFDVFFLFLLIDYENHIVFLVLARAWSTFRWMIHTMRDTCMHPSLLKLCDARKVCHWLLLYLWTLTTNTAAIQNVSFQNRLLHYDWFVSRSELFIHTLCRGLFVVIAIAIAIFLIWFSSIISISSIHMLNVMSVPSLLSQLT